MTKHRGIKGTTSPHIRPDAFTQLFQHLIELSFQYLVELVGGALVAEALVDECAVEDDFEQQLSGEAVEQARRGRLAEQMGQA
jgi:hypothetical protein